MAELPLLDPLDQRILGSLMEKERTVSATYPLTLNALRTACNQTSSRDPVSDYSEPDIEHALSSLKLRRLVRFDHSARGSRTMKYHQRLVEAIELDPDERAILTVLLLRGANAPGELRTRTERLHPFTDRGAVEACLARMAARPQPLVRELPRQAGQHDARWIHLLGPVNADDDAGGPPGDAVAPQHTLPDGPERDLRVVSAYETVAATYADNLLTELNDKPFDRWLLERVARLAAPGPVADVGCGPGHVADFLASSGVEVTGFDLAPGMVDEARRRFPHLTLEVADLLALPAPPTGPGWSAITAWYALCHLAPAEIPDAIRALARALRPGGTLAIAVHAGSEVRHFTDWWGHEVDLHFVFHDPHAVRTAMQGAGLIGLEWYLRSSLAEVEVETERLYVLGHRDG